MNQFRKKVIPWHVQQRYMESLSQLSLNQSISAAMYKKKIKSLQRNNKHLALALQRSRYLYTEKENLLIDNGKILEIINFSRVKLMDMSINMKQATECLDETLLLLNSSLADSLSKNSCRNRCYRNDFKNKLQEISRNSPIEEVAENSDRNVKVQSFTGKGKISRVDGSVSSPNKKCKLTKRDGSVSSPKKKCKLTKRGRPTKRYSKDVPKSKEEFSSATPTTSSKNTHIKTSKKSVPALGIQSPNRKKSLPTNFNIESASSSKISTSTSSKRFATKTKQRKNKQESLDKKSKSVKVVLTDIAEAFLPQETENYHSPLTNGPISVSQGANVTSVSPNSPEDDILIKKYFSSELTYKQKNSVSNSDVEPFSIVDDNEIPNCSQSTSNLSNLSSIPEIDEPSPASLSDKREDSAVLKMEQIENCYYNIKQNNGNYIKMADSEKDKRSCKSHNLKVINKVHFYYDEDSIEKVEGHAVASKDRIRKTISKCKARKTVSHKKKNIPSESTAPKSNFMLSDNVSKLGKNSFLVTAEVHSPPNGNHAQQIKSKICVSKKMEPCVVLTDIFKSNRGLLSEMVGNGLHENACLEKTTNEPAVALSERNTTYAMNKNSHYVKEAYMDCENAENRSLPEDREIIKQEKQVRRSKIVSYKEPSLIVKMRRLF